MKIDPEKYKTAEATQQPIMYLTGQKIKNENLIDIQSNIFN